MIKQLGLARCGFSGNLPQNRFRNVSIEAVPGCEPLNTPVPPHPVGRELAVVRKYTHPYQACSEPVTSSLPPHFPKGTVKWYWLPQNTESKPPDSPQPPSLPQHFLQKVLKDTDRSWCWVRADESLQPRQCWHGAFLTWEAHGGPRLHRLLLAQDHHVAVLEAIGGQGPVVVSQRPLRIHNLCPQPPAPPGRERVRKKEQDVILLEEVKKPFQNPPDPSQVSEGNV